MRLFIKYLIFSCFCLCLFSTCKRYKDNKGIQLRSVDYRIRGTYQITLYSVNNIDSTQYLTGTTKINFIHEKHDAPIINGYNEGSWRLSSDKKNLLIQINDKPYNTNLIFVKMNDEISWRIYKLTKNEMKIKTSYNNYDYEILFTKLSQL